MTMTPEQENELLRKYTPYIMAAAKHYRSACRTSTMEIDDLFQECALAFLREARKAENLESFEQRLPHISMKSACALFTVLNQPITYPVRVPSLKLIRERKTCPLSRVEDQIGECRDIEDTEERVTWQQYLDTLNGFDRSIIQEKENGLTGREIAQKFGITPVRVSRSIKRSEAGYKRFIN